MTGSDPTAHLAVRGAPGWRDIRTLGPVLLIVFGLVLVFAPMTTIGVGGSVGNAGAVASKIGEDGPPGCPTQEQIDNLIEQANAYAANPDIFIGVPLSIEQINELVANCSCDEPFGQGGGGGIVDPCLAVDPPPEEPEEPVEVVPPDEPVVDEEPVEVAPPAEPVEDEVVAEVPETEVVAAAPPAPRSQLPETGNDGAIGTAAVGSLLAALGVVLLVTSRRRTVTS